jgi:regulator of RNase E activity RraA
MGFTHQFLPQAIQPLRDDMVVVGRAMPVLEADFDGSEGASHQNPLLNQPFGLMLRALDELKLNEVYICSGSSLRYALWGELMSCAARKRGAVGAVVNGYSRDTKGILEQQFPCFSRGRYAQDQRPRGLVIGFRCSIDIEGVRIKPDCLIFGDLDGVIVIPREVEDEVLERATQKATDEKTVFNAIRNGMGAQDAWDTYGIL